MKHLSNVVLQRGNESTEVHIHCPDKDQMGTIKEIIKLEMGDPGLGKGERCVYFVLTPDSKYKTFDEFEKWLRGELEKSEDINIVTV
jgi:hypothetical protein